MSRLLSYALVAMSLVLAGCAMKPVYVSQIEPSAPQPMVARQLSTPVYVVLDDVPDHLSTEGNANGAKPVEVYEMRTFVERDVPKVLEPYFETVAVLDEAGDAPDAPHILVPVRVSAVGTTLDKAATADAVAYKVTAWIDWAVAIRRDSDEDFLFSFAGRSVGARPMTTVWETEATFKSALEQALMDFTDEFVDSDVLALLREWESADEVPIGTSGSP